MSEIPESELILNANQRVYHLDLSAEHIADDVILVGDPGRVKKISQHFSKLEFSTSHREFITHTGLFEGKALIVISTGIGTDNIDIVLNELDAAVNINLKTRKELEHKRRLRIFRLGTSGALQENIPVNSLVASAYGLGLDGLLHFYDSIEQVNNPTLCKAFESHVSWPSTLAAVYAVPASEMLLEKFNPAIYCKGITATAPGFYAPQGRELRLKARMKNMQALLSAFQFEDLKITNFEMETSALYGLGKLLGHECLTVCVIIANRMRNEFTKDLEGSETILIDTFLQQLSQLHDQTRTH
jgi:uridine phosphorylase